MINTQEPDTCRESNRARLKEKPDMVYCIKDTRTLNMTIDTYNALEKCEMFDLEVTSDDLVTCPFSFLGNIHFHTEIR